MNGARLPARPLLTIPQVARRYDIGSESTLYCRARANELPGVVRLNNRWYVRIAILEAWLRGDLPDAVAS